MYQELYYYTQDSPQNGYRFWRLDNGPADRSPDSSWRLSKHGANNGIHDQEPDLYHVDFVKKHDGIYPTESETITVTLNYGNTETGASFFVGSEHQFYRDDSSQSERIIRKDILRCSDGITVYSVDDFYPDTVVFRTIEYTEVDGYVGCSQVEDAIALAASFSPAPMSWDYVVTTPAYLEAQSIGQ